MYSYILPAAISLPLGYNCRISLPMSAIKERMNKKIDRFNITFSIIAYREGEVFFEKKISLNEKTKDSVEIDIPDQKNFSDKSGFAELEILENDKKLIFGSRLTLSFYSIFFSDNKKSFLSDNAYKYGSPSVINQMSSIKRYLDAYPTVTIDKNKDLGETLVLINPYPKKIFASIVTYDKRTINGVLVNPYSSKEVSLSQLLNVHEKNWEGHIQIKAKNRLITFIYKHSLKDNRLISDYEHLDPFRGDPTCIALTQLLRNKIGDFFKSFAN